MITDTHHFDAQVSKILEELDNENLEITFVKSGLINNFTKNYIVEQYKDLFLTFPFQIETASDKVGISLYSTEILKLYYELGTIDTKVPHVVVNELKQARLQQIDLNDHKFLFEEFVNEFIHGLIYSYKDVIKNTKALYFFSNIDDEKIILMNLLKRYKSIAQDKTKQLRAFWGLTITKTLSDLFLEILIEFIEQRLNVLCTNIDIGDLTYKATYIDSQIQQIEWLGTQQEFCELLVELEGKLWIEKIKDGERKQLIDSLSKIFSFQKTKRSLTSDPIKSIYQTFKGEMERGERIFPFLANERYNRKFADIKKNNC